MVGSLQADEHEVCPYKTMIDYGNRTMTVVQKIHALRRELEGRYHLAYERHNLCGRQISVTCVADAEALFSRRAIFGPDGPDGQGDTHPYWACLWSSALVLAEVLVSGDHMQSGDRVLELGAGLGLVSAVACMKRAVVTATDYQPDALKFTRINCLQIAGVEPDVQILDWYHPPEDRQYTVLLGSDLVYDPDFYDPLMACFDALLEPEGRVLLSEPNREMNRPFFDQLPDAGWYCEPILEHPDATVYRITRAALSLSGCA